MHLIVCIDSRDGMTFGGKRQSTDRRLAEYLLESTKHSKLWMNAYSAKLFDCDDICVDEDFLQKARQGEYCFLENAPLPVTLDLESVTLCCWNRHYPSTQKFPRQILDRMHLESIIDFPGNSHEKITIERYTL